MLRTVTFNCEKCGSTKMAVAKELGDGTIVGYCLGCGYQISGYYVPVADPPDQATVS
jgi:hypothetical protein